MLIARNVRSTSALTATFTFMKACTIAPAVKASDTQSQLLLLDNEKILSRTGFNVDTPS